jgi:hypothetical protein
MKKLESYFDVIYKTTSGRAMIAKRVSAKSKAGAMRKVIKEMSKSSTFKRCLMAIKL